MRQMGLALSQAGISANAMTLFGLVVGLAAAVAIAVGWFWWALLLICISRLADGLDGAIARVTRKTDFGGYLDVTADFLFYGAIPMGFVLVDPSSNAIPGAILLLSFYFNGGTVLGYAVLAEKHDLTIKQRTIRSLYFSEGLLEGTETIAFFIVIVIWPTLFPVFALIFAALTFTTGFMRWHMAWRIFGNKNAQSDLVEPESQIRD